MQHKSVIFGILLICSLSIKAQTTPIYMFSKYEKGVVYLKNHTQSHTELNYDAANLKLSFIEKGEALEINDVSLIDSVVVNNRKFIPYKNHFIEHIAIGNGSLLIDWRLKEKYTGKKVGAMGIANGGAIQKVNIGLLYAKMQSDEKSTEIYESVNENTYYLNIPDGQIGFRNEKQLLKGFEKEKEDIKAYIHSVNTNFSDVTDVISLATHILENIIK